MRQTLERYRYTLGMRGNVPLSGVGSAWRQVVKVRPDADPHPLSKTVVTRAEASEHVKFRIALGSQ